MNLISKDELTQLLKDYGINDNINHIHYYHNAFIHKSICGKNFAVNAKSLIIS